MKKFSDKVETSEEAYVALLVGANSFLCVYLLIINLFVTLDFLLLSKTTELIVS